MSEVLDYFSALIDVTHFGLTLSEASASLLD